MSTFSGRLHGVFLTIEGTFYSLLIGRRADPDAQSAADVSGLAKGESWLSEPFEEYHVAELPEADLLIWLTLMSGFGTLAG